MTDPLLWTLIAVQIAMGAFDTLVHHEMSERLAWRPSQASELRLHAVRNIFYAVIFLTLGWAEPHGWVAWALIALLTVEIGITLWDFVEEDMTRALPATERVNHTLLALNYGAILILAVPHLIDWAARETALLPAYYGVWSWMCLASALAVTLFGLRDWFAAVRAPHLRENNPAPLVEGLPPSHVLVTGGTGFVGRRLVAGLVGAGHRVTVLTRTPSKALELPTPLTIVTDLDQIAGDTRIDAIINLAGEGVADGLWTAAKRDRIIGSRIAMIDRLEALVARLSSKPATLISASAIGWYGIRDAAPVTETTGPVPCFSHESCAVAEQAAMRLEDHGLRVVQLRIGLALGVDGGLLARMLAPFEFGLGGPLGNGRQVMSWIHRDDLVRAIAHCLATPSLSGPVNATAPEPVANRVFTRALGIALRRPALIPLPAVAIRLLLGDMGRELLLGGQAVLPARLTATGFTFRHPGIDDALAAILSPPRVAAKGAPTHHLVAETQTPSS